MVNYYRFRIEDSYEDGFGSAPSFFLESEGEIEFVKNNPSREPYLEANLKKLSEEQYRKELEAATPVPTTAGNNGAGVCCELSIPTGNMYDPVTDYYFRSEDKITVRGQKPNQKATLRELTLREHDEMIRAIDSGREEKLITC